MRVPARQTAGERVRVAAWESGPDGCSDGRWETADQTARDARIGPGHASQGSRPWEWTDLPDADHLGRTVPGCERGPHGRVQNFTPRWSPGSKRK